MARQRPPSLERLLAQALAEEERPAAFVLADHNGSGKSSLWYQRLVDRLKIPLINADRLTASILASPDPATQQMPEWAQRLRDDDQRWQILSQQGVKAFRELVMAQRMPFAFETVFSHWRPLPDGRHESKVDDIIKMQRAGYFVIQQQPRPRSSTRTRACAKTTQAVLRCPRPSLPRRSGIAGRRHTVDGAGGRAIQGAAQQPGMNSLRTAALHNKLDKRALHVGPLTLLALDRRIQSLSAAAGPASVHHAPTFGMLAHGSALGSASPACSSSMEMLSGERTKAMWPSRGGRLMVTPCATRRSQVA
jgi:hypothetical protein